MSGPIVSDKQSIFFSQIRLQSRPFFIVRGGYQRRKTPAWDLIEGAYYSPKILTSREESF